jgi:hypothetical protein
VTQQHQQVTQQHQQVTQQHQQVIQKHQQVTQQHQQVPEQCQQVLHKYLTRCLLTNNQDILIASTQSILNIIFSYKIF